MVGDFIISIVNFFFAKLIVPILPTNLPLLPIDNLVAVLNSDVKNDIIYAFSGIGSIMPIDWILIVFCVIIFAEVLLVFIKMAMYLINLIRGSGA